MATLFISCGTVHSDILTGDTAALASAPRGQVFDECASSKYFASRPGRLDTKFESVSDSLGGARPSLNRMAASDKNLDAAIQARFSGSAG
ncbi:hypothetical protein PCANC_07839 [Puccinia coronata f. sp. avenae]|uniref:Uncharacterized protein n=1 Tax=Puccinia coronata f. sp. avenae TaxID=200324 RepID=A0A2N5VC13_9BASI|nr:hypothetical protein PCANC_07839 [Puccinia coronata f. sp. avenae]